MTHQTAQDASLIAQRIPSPELVSALKHSGAADADATLIAATARPIGIGALADTLLLDLTWNSAHAGPASVVAKLPSTDEQSAQTAASIGAYDREVRFYLDLAPRTSVRVPLCFGTLQVEGGTGILLEDLSALSPGDQFNDASNTVITRARQQLVALQAPFWNDPQVAGLDWLHRRQGVPIHSIAERMAVSWHTSADRLTGDFSPAERNLIDRFVSGANEWAQSLGGPFSLSHHDYRVDNMLLGDDTLVVLDWQTVGLGAPMFDVAYLLGTSLNPVSRAAIERAEIEQHVEELSALGVTWSVDDAWQSYRQAAFAVLLMLVPATGSVKRSERTDAMYRRLLRFGARQALDLDATEFLVGT